MFYEPKDGHGLPHNPFTAIVAPRPIGWIGSRGKRGDNLAPYSFFNATAYQPPQVMFCSTGVKDSLRNLRETGVFSVNIVTSALMTAMNLSAGTYPQGEDEFALAGLEKSECRTIDCPRVAASPASLECRVVTIETLLGENNYMIKGEVTGVHLRDDCLTDGYYDATQFGLMARLGYKDYADVRERIVLARPGET